MEWFVAVAAKSLIVAGGTLFLLKLMPGRSASDRSWIAHLGLFALLLLPAATFALPALNVPGPEFLTAGSAATAPIAASPAPEVAPEAATFRTAGTSAVSPTPESWWVGVDWTFAGYALPVVLLLLLTLIAVGRLVLLKSRAQVLVDAHWLSALACAQRRMGFKNGTALLVSSEVRSPVSWGMMRPVIVLNDAAAEAREDAEAIIAHELAHVARLDWAKLLLARIAVAIFWFNPLVWLLAREAHQLREEAADDAVLSADIDDTDYARLLVGVARHECNGMLLGAHGVAPSRNSLSRRVRRVLDQALTRAPGGWRWTSAAAFFAAGMAVPVAALNFVPTTPLQPVSGRGAVGGQASLAGAGTVAAAGTASVVHPHSDSDTDSDAGIDVDVDRGDSASRDAGHMSQDQLIETAISAKIHGVTGDYARDIRALSPRLRNATSEDLVGFRVHGVTPQFVRDLAAAGYPNLSIDDVETAAVHRIDADYVRQMNAVSPGRISWDSLVEMKVLGLTPSYVRELNRRGFRNLSPEQMVKMKIFGVLDEERTAGGP